MSPVGNQALLLIAVIVCLVLVVSPNAIAFLIPKRQLSRRVLSPAEFPKSTTATNIGELVMAGSNGFLIDQGSQSLRVGTEEISLITGGVERVKVDSSGKIDIGSSSTQAVKLDSSAISLFTGGVERVKVDSSGQIDIGSSSSQSIKLDSSIVSVFAGGAERIKVDSSGQIDIGSSSSQSIKLDSSGVSLTTDGVERLNVSSSGEVSINNQVNIGVSGINATTTPALNLVSQASHYDGNVSQTYLFNGLSGYISLANTVSRDSTTANLMIGSNGVISELTSIKSNGSGLLPLNFGGSSYYFALGNVGIGVINPTSKLHVNGNITSTGFVSNGYTTMYGSGLTLVGATIGTIDYIGQIGACDTTKSGGLRIFAKQEVNLGTWQDTRIYFQHRAGTSDNASTIFGPYSLCHTGTVGVGTTSALANFHVHNSSVGIATSSSAYTGQTLDRYMLRTTHSSATNTSTSTLSQASSISLKAQDLSWSTNILYGSELILEGGLSSSGALTGASIIFKTSNTEKVRVTPSGNVGIGITSPVYKVDISGGLSLLTTASNNGEAPDGGVTHGLLLTNTKSGTSEYSLALGMDQTLGIGYMNAAGNGAYQPVCLQTRGGYVGIGNTNPAYTLDVNGTARVSGNLLLPGNLLLQFPGQSAQTIYATSTDGYNPTGDNNLMIKSWWGIGFKSYDNIVRSALNTRTGGAYFAGRVGIGLTNPNYPLHVVGTNSGPGGGGHWLHNSLGYQYRDNLSWQVSIYAAGGIQAGDYVAAGSDIRIKKNIKPFINALSLIDKLDVVSYDKIDFKAKGSDVGVIAQNVQKILPRAVVKDKRIIPNIYRCAEGHYQLQNGMIRVLCKGVVENVAIKIFVNRDDMETDFNKEPINCTDESFDVTTWDNYSESDNVFVYGQEIEDFLSVEKDQIGILAAAGIKEMKQLIDEQQQTITSLMDRLSRIESTLRLV